VGVDMKIVCAYRNIDLSKIWIIMKFYKFESKLVDCGFLCCDLLVKFKFLNKGNSPQLIRFLLRNPKVQCRIYKSPTLVLIMSHTKPVYTLLKDPF
jgi:hypothetical protein